MKKFLSLVVFSNAIVLSAQTERAAFTHSGKGAAITFATDYQCAGINPSNLGWARKYPEKKITFGIAEFGYSLSTSAFEKTDLKSDFVKSITGSPEDFTYPEKVEASRIFTDAPLTINTDIMIAGISWQDDSIGGFAFVIRDRVQWFTRFNQEVSELMFQGFNAPYFELLTGDFDHDGDFETIPNDENVTEDMRDDVVSGATADPQNVSDIMDDSFFDMIWYREYGLNYGRRVVNKGDFELFGGVGVKYLQGIGFLDISSENGDFTAQSALSPGFDIDYGEDADRNPSTLTGDGFKAAGKGFAFDIGLSALINDKVKIGVSYVDIGKITWDGNVYVAADSSLAVLDENGFDNYNFFEQADNFASDNGIYEWEGVKEAETKLPSTLRTGIGYIISEKTEVGFEAVLPMEKDVPGTYDKPVIALGGEYHPKEWLGLNLGMTTGGRYPFRLAGGLIFTSQGGTWEAGFGTRDLITLFGGGSEPTLSICFGLLRFRV
jgi:hypothetical protein